MKQLRNFEVATVAGFDRVRKLATLSAHDEERIARCKEALQTFDPESAYEENDREDGLRRSVIGERVAMLVGAFPNGAPSDPVVYVTTLVESICTVEALCLPALESAIWQITGTIKFIPAITEVLEEVNRQQAKWEERFWAIHNLANKSRRLVARIEELEPELLEAAKVRAEQERAAAKTRAVEQAQQHLNDAREEYEQALAELAERRDLVASSLAWCAQWQQTVLEREQALAEALAKLIE
jgi:DNA repair exonuclease SbcCD ATPase subunit